MFEKLIEKLFGKKPEDKIVSEIKGKGYEVKKEDDAYIVDGKGEHGITIKECNSFAYLRDRGYELKRERGRLYIRPREY